METMFYIYAVYIGDGYADIEPVVRDDGTDRPEEGAGYWYSYRHAEVDCPCGQGDGPLADCPVCDGFGLAQGEPFTVTRYTFATEEDAERVAREVDDVGDGYERAGALAEAVRRGDCTSADVVEWDPDHWATIQAHLSAREEDTEGEGV